MNITLLKIAGIKPALTGIALTLIVTSCTAPKSITDSGKVTPKHQIKAGASYNIQYDSINPSYQQEQQPLIEMQSNKVELSY